MKGPDLGDKYKDQRVIRAQISEPQDYEMTETRDRTTDIMTTR